jgi:hypothetical protein
MTVLRVDTIAGTGTTFGPLLDGNLEFNSQNYIILPKGSSSQEGVLRTTEDVIGVGGTYYDNLVLAMPFNEATGLTDISSRNRNPGAYGNVAISTIQSKYYGSSAYFDGTGDYLSISDSEDFNFSLNNYWTVECWAYYSGSNDRVYIYFQGDMASNDNRFMMFYGGSTWTIFATEGGSTKFLVSFADTLTANSWFHIAFVRDAQTFYIFKNGSLIGSNTDSDAAPNLSTPIYIGSARDDSTQKYYQGYIQDLRIYKGLAKYTSNFTPPERIAEIGVGFKTGQLRYNTDSNKVELYDGNQWTELQISNVGLGTAGDTGPGARGLFGGGQTLSNTNYIEYVNISSTGNSVYFGDLIEGARNVPGSCASSTRGIWGGGISPVSNPASINTIQYVTISSIGNSQDFGDLTRAHSGLSGCSSSTRGVFMGSADPAGTNVMDYITISSTGDARDFGDLTTSKRYAASCSSSTRGINGGGGNPSNTNIITFITISTLGDAKDFGDLILGRGNFSACSNSNRGLFGGSQGPSVTNIIDFITISTIGNAINFGDLTSARAYSSSCASPTRGVWAGGGPTPVDFNIIDYVTISTQGNAVDFGDLNSVVLGAAGLSNAHGGL